jgi:hypothetical protein
MVLKPDASIFSEYLPGGRGEMLKRPESVEVRTVVTFVPTFVAVIVALGTAAPVPSVTVP